MRPWNLETAVMGTPWVGVTKVMLVCATQVTGHPKDSWYREVFVLHVPNTSHHMSFSVTFCEGDAYTYFTDICMHKGPCVHVRTYIRTYVGSFINSTCPPVSCWSLSQLVDTPQQLRPADMHTHIHMYIHTRTCTHTQTPQRDQRLWVYTFITVCIGTVCIPCFAYSNSK